jgi:hypothetical protein
MSKKELTLSAYAELTTSSKGAPMARKDVLAALSARVGISKACASTYLSNIRSGKWTGETAKAATKTKTPGVAQARGLTTEMVTKMSNKELVAVYNKKSAAPIAKFRDRATGLKRVMTLYKMI